MLNRSRSNRLGKKALIFQILNEEPNLSARELQRRARDAGLTLAPLAAYRALASFRDSGGLVEESETRCFKIVSEILREAGEGEHLTAAQIKQRAQEGNVSVHQATVYRVLARLCEIGLVLAADRGRMKCYEWRRSQLHHGHLTCIECGRTIEFEQEYLDDVGKQICARIGYDFARIEFTVRSMCSYCRQT